mgnify:CR=1 FL=1
MTTPETAFQALLGVPPDSIITIHRLDVLDWGQTLVLTGAAGAQPFTVRYTGCREMRWRVYAHESAGESAAGLVSFVPGRDQHRSPAQIFTTYFGLSLYYGAFELSTA